MKKRIGQDALRAIPLGGHGEIGKTCWLFEYKEEIVIVNFGMMLPPQDLTGVDLILPCPSYLIENQDKIKALIITSAHDDLAGGVSYLLGKVKIPKIYGSKLAIECIKRTMPEGLEFPEYEEIEARKEFKIGNEFEIKPIQNTSVLPDTYGIYIRTSAGNVLYTGSYKVDQTPYDDSLYDYFSYSDTGEEGVDLLIADSSNVESLGYCQYERVIIKRFDEILNSPSRVLVVSYACNLYKYQILFDLAAKKKRKVLLSGDYLISKIEAAISAGFIKVDRKIFIQDKDIDSMKDGEVLVLLSGKYGDFLKALIELADEKHHSVKLKEKDILVVSANSPPGTARILAHTVDKLFVKKVQVIGGRGQGVHVSGHAAQEECKFILTVTKPRSFVPSYGEERQLVIYGKIAETIGVNHNDVHILKNGEVLELREQVAKVCGRVSAESIYYNHAKGLDIDEITMKERQSLSDEGTITIALAIDEKRSIVAGPEIFAEACSFAKGKDWRAFCLGTSELVKQGIQDSIKKNPKDLKEIKKVVKDIVNKTVLELIGKRPLINVSIQEIIPEAAKK